VGAVAALVFAGSAEAVKRYAAPGGSGTAATTTGCIVQSPESSVCKIFDALAASSSGDDVTLLGGGNYPTQTATLIVPPGVTAHGGPGARAVIPSSNNLSMLLSGGSVLRDAVIFSTGTNIALDLGSNALAERVFVDGGTNGARPCATGGSGSVLRDSVCWSRTNGTPAIHIIADFAITTTVTLRNVTAINLFGLGLDAAAFAGGSTAIVNATNTIVRGDPDGSDVAATGGMPLATATITLDHSNYSNEMQGTGGTITDPGSGTNVTTDPAFQDASVGLFQQTGASSGTIDRGTAGTVNGLGVGSLALDGQPRCLGTAPDIGAYEFAAAPCPQPPATGPPATGPPATGPPEAAPKKKCKKKRGKRSAAVAKKKCKKKKRR
jgi:hypothetical protein